MIVQGLALHREDRRIGFEQVAALHAGGAGPGAHEQRVVGIAEGNVRVVRADDALEQRKGAVVQFHRHAPQGIEGRRDFQQLQDHRLIPAEHLPSRYAEHQRIADLARRPRHRHSHRFCHVASRLFGRVF